MYFFFVLSTVGGCFLTDFLPPIVIDSFGIAFFMQLLLRSSFLTPKEIAACLCWFC
jgi:hypothetical protein